MRFPFFSWHSKSFSFDGIETVVGILKELFGDHQRDGEPCFVRRSNRRIYGNEIVGTQVVSNWRAHDV